MLEAVPEPVVLSVGGGEGGVGQDALGHIQVLTTDVIIGRRTDVVADAHNLPFPDDFFDAIIIQAVLEHVIDPRRCVEEIRRVLRHGGLVYAETPFMQQVHMGRYDFTRFTSLGHRWLFREFEEIDSGLTGGPGSAAAWAMAYLLASFARTKRQRRYLFAIGRMGFFWLRFLDHLVVRNDASHDGAIGFYFIGKCVETNLTASELIQRYKGGLNL
jgi:SAM-dependent methyltransferase